MTAIRWLSQLVLCLFPTQSIDTGLEHLVWVDVLEYPVISQKRDHGGSNLNEGRLQSEMPRIDQDDLGIR